MKTRTTKTTNTKPAPETLEWLLAAGRNGVRRIDTLSWGRLGKIYRSRNATRQIRQAIERAARRCGYCPQTIMGLNAW